MGPGLPHVERAPPLRAHPQQHSVVAPAQLCLCRENREQPEQAHHLVEQADPHLDVRRQPRQHLLAIHGPTAVGCHYRLDTAAHLPIPLHPLTLRLDPLARVRLQQGLHLQQQGAIGGAVQRFGHGGEDSLR